MHCIPPMNRFTLIQDSRRVLGLRHTEYHIDIKLKIPVCRPDGAEDVTSQGVIDKILFTVLLGRYIYTAIWPL